MSVVAPGRCIAGVVRDLNRVETYLERQAAVPEFATMRRMEDRLARAGEAEWTERSNASIEPMLRAAPATLTVAFLESIPGRLIGGFGTWPSDDLAGLMEEVTEETYKLSAQTILRKSEGVPRYQQELVFRQARPLAEIVPSFDIQDEEAMAYLANSQTFWLREHFDTDTVNAIRGAGWVELSGLSGRQAGEELRKLAERQFGVGAFASFSRAYFEGTAVNASTTARTVGAVFEMRSLGIEKYRITAVNDERTTDICLHLDGKVFAVAQGAARMDEIIATGDPNGIRDLHPWRPSTFRDDLSDIGVDIQVGVALSDEDAAAVANAGFGFPPYHFKCRTSADIA